MKKVLFTLLLLFAGFTVQASAQDRSGKVFWRGMVDDRLHIVIRSDRIEHRTVGGTAQTDGIFAFTTPLPDQPVTVGVLRKAGRSKKISVIQQPTAQNDFTAIVEIHDEGGGAKEYQIEIFWR